MSHRWRGKPDGETLAAQEMEVEEHDLATKYVNDLIKMHEEAEQKPDFCSRVLGYELGAIESRGVSQLPRPESRQVSEARRRSSITRSQITSQTATAGHIPLNTRTSNEIPKHSMSQFSPGAHVTTPSPTLTSGRPMYRHPSMPHAFNSNLYDHFPQNDELTAISHTLLGNEFMELDRIITLDGTSFSLDIESGWPAYAGGQVYE